MLNELLGTKTFGDVLSPVGLLQNEPLKLAETNLRSPNSPPIVFQATNIWEVSSTKPVVLLIVMLIVLPEICRGPFDKIKAEHTIGVGVEVPVLVGVAVLVGVGVFDGILEAVGVPLGVYV